MQRGLSFTTCQETWRKVKRKHIHPNGKANREILYVAMQTRLLELSFGANWVVIHEGNKHTLITRKHEERSESDSGTHHKRCKS